ncbi:MAG: hypothetical protein Ta2A_04560 [Treponemataceae bacterium]|nr:MAG: hypothetical protein Ta2A_04560 [Treponemataceae bacterium]
MNTQSGGKTALLIIDPQNDFCDERGALFVPNSPGDCARIAAFLKTAVQANSRSNVQSNTRSIDSIFVTLDTHEAYHIAHGAFWRTRDGTPPSSFTLITEKMLNNGDIVPVDAAKSDYALQYVRSLEQNGKFALCIWPAHCLIGTWGHNVQQDVLDAIRFWEAQNAPRGKFASFIVKGKNPYTEHYSALKAEVPLADDAGTMFDLALIKQLDAHDTIVVAGEALSHCVANTVRDLLAAGIDAHKITLLTDCMSPVTGFEDAGKSFVSEVGAKEVHLAKSSEL